MLCSNIRHTLLVGVSVALAFLAPLSAAATEQRLVIRSARVLTMDAKQPEGRAIAIVDGRIAAVGSEEAIAPYIEGAQVYDLPGRLVLPGFQDAHNHLIWSGTELQGLDLTGVSDLAGLRAAIEQGMQSLPENAWVRASGWDIAAFPEAKAADLDAITGSRPTVLTSSDGHSAWANSAALKLAGITAHTKAPDGGRIETDAKGDPTGVLRESATALVTDRLPDYPERQVDAGLAAAQAEAHSYGITAIIDPTTKEWMLRGYKRFDDAGKLSLHVKAGVEIEPKEGAAGVESVLALRARYSSPRLQVNAVKFYVDGVIETGTAALLEAYTGSNQAGELLFTPEALKELAIAADAAKLQLHSHAIGDRAVRATLDAYEAAGRANGARDRRPQISHVELVDPLDIPRFARLGILANIQGLWAYPETYIVDLTEPKIGPERSQWLYPFGALKQAGATLVAGSDWSVSSMNPLEAIQVAVTRQDPADPAGRVLTPQHRLEVMDMLRAYTVDSAFAAFDEQQSGTLTVGKRADIVVLDQDITDGPPAEIASSKVLLTIADGIPVFTAPELPGPARH